jgi:hypothetical protein
MSTPRKSLLRQLEKLRAERERIVREKERHEMLLSGQIIALDRAILMLQEDDEEDDEEITKSGRGEAKTLLLALLEEVAEVGLNAGIAEELANQRGVPLKRGTAASNLSRLKADGVIAYDGDRYRLPKFARQPGLVVPLTGTNS